MAQSHVIHGIFVIAGLVGDKSIIGRHLIRMSKNQDGWVTAKIGSHFLQNHPSNIKFVVFVLDVGQCCQYGKCCRTMLVQIKRSPQMSNCTFAQLLSYFEEAIFYKIRREFMFTIFSEQYWSSSSNEVSQLKVLYIYMSTLCDEAKQKPKQQKYKIV